VIPHDGKLLKPEFLAQPQINLLLKIAKIPGLTFIIIKKRIMYQ